MQCLNPALVGLVIVAMSSMGCTSKTPLADIPEPALSVSIPDAPRTAIVTVSPGDETDWAGKSGKLLAANARATLNGVALTRRRGKSVADDFAYDRDCLVEFGATAEPIWKKGPGLSLEISDESATWKLELPTALAPRSFALLSSGPVRRGQRVALRWSPASDRFDTRVVGFEIYGASNGPGTGVVVHDIEVNEGELAFTVPLQREAVSSGPALLRVVGTTGIRPASGKCPLRECAVSVLYSVPPLPITLED